MLRCGLALSSLRPAACCALRARADGAFFTCAGRLGLSRTGGKTSAAELFPWDGSGRHGSNVRKATAVDSSGSRHGLDHARHHADTVLSTQYAASRPAWAERPLLPSPAHCAVTGLTLASSCLLSCAVRHVSPKNPWLPLLTPHQLVEINSAFKNFGTPSLAARRPAQAATSSL